MEDKIGCGRNVYTVVVSLTPIDEDLAKSIPRVAQANMVVAAAAVKLDQMGTQVASVKI